MQKLAFPLVLAAALSPLALAGPAAAASCSSVTVEHGGDEESAYAIRTSNIGCGPARRTVRAYLKTGEAPGSWAVKTNPSSFTLYTGTRKITFKAAS